MPDRPQHSNRKLISEQAADWLLRFRDGELSINDRHEYVRWLKQSPLHVREILELSALQGLLRSSDLTGMPPPPRKPPAMPEGVSSIVERIRRHDKEDGPSDERRQSPWRHWKSAASGCLARIEFAGRAISKFVGIRG
jgi:ferric-dicitrate binding protein FerR (iron transport regulator)